MKEINTKPDVRETGNRPGRTELPQERFNPNKPCDNIRQVIFKDNMWKIYDTKSPIPVDSLPKQRFGEHKHHGKDFLLFEKPSSSGSGSIYNVCDSKGKPLTPQTINVNSSKIGKFVGPSGENMTFERANMLYTYNKNFQQIGNPIPKPRS